MDEVVFLFLLSGPFGRVRNNTYFNLEEKRSAVYALLFMCSV